MWVSKKEQGFSLLEILIAITLLAFITLAVVNVTDVAFNTQDRTNEYNKNSLLVESAMARFEWDVSQIYSPLYFSTQQNVQFGTAQAAGGAEAGAQGGIDAGAQGGFDGGGFGGPDAGGIRNPNVATQMLNPALQMYYSQMMSRFERNERFVSLSKEGEPIPRFYAPEKGVFEFFTSSNRRKMENTRQSHFAWVRYQLIDQAAEEDEEKVHPEMPAGVKSFARFFSADNPFDDNRLNVEAGAGVKAAVLLKNVESLEFQFWDLQKRKWQTNLKTIQNGETLIRGVKVIITWWDSDGKKSIQRVFRPHWPLVAPNDAASMATPQAGAQGGNTTAGATGGEEGGGDGGNQGGGN